MKKYVVVLWKNRSIGSDPAAEKSLGRFIKIPNSDKHEKRLELKGSNAIMVPPRRWSALAQMRRMAWR